MYILTHSTRYVYINSFDSAVLNDITDLSLKILLDPSQVSVLCLELTWRRRICCLRKWQPKNTPRAKELTRRKVSNACGYLAGDELYYCLTLVSLAIAHSRQKAEVRGVEKLKRVGKVQSEATASGESDLLLRSLISQLKGLSARPSFS
jgi:hypothetical protein